MTRASHHQRAAAGHPQRGAALAVALIILVVLTLLGVAAVRFTQVELRLAQNAESHMTAQQRADSLLDYVLSKSIAFLPANDDGSYRACRLPAPIPDSALFACASSDIKITMPGNDDAMNGFGYVETKREQPLFVTVNVFRGNSGQGNIGGTSGRNYDFARYTVTSGYNRASEGFSAAEITAGVLVLHVKTAGVNYL